MILAESITVPRWVQNELMFHGNKAIAYSLFLAFPEREISQQDIMDTLSNNAIALRKIIASLAEMGYIRKLQRGSTYRRALYILNVDFVPEKYRKQEVEC